MARPLRVEYKGAWYHVINHSISQHNLFLNDDQREAFLDLLGDLSKTYQVEVHAYLLMDNEYHLLICTRAANLSDAMRYLNGVYTQRYNRSFNRFGPLFRGQYKSVIISADMYLAQLSRYIHWLPVHMKLCENPAGYPWSSCRAYLDLTTVPTWLYRNKVLNRFDSKGKKNDYGTYLNKGVDQEICHYYKQKHVGDMLGPKSFRTEIIKNHVQVKRCEQQAALELNSSKPSIAELVDFMDKHFTIHNCNIGNLSDKVKRNIVMTMCRDIGGYSLK